jgi:hypothetical protein
MLRSCQKKPINIKNNKYIFFISTHIFYKHKHRIHLHEDLPYNGICGYILYKSYSWFLNNQDLYLSHVFFTGFTTHTLYLFCIHLIMFFFLNFIEEVISIFCFPFTCILNVPFRCLDFPIWNIIFYCKRRYIPYTSVIWLSRIVPIV